MGNSEGAVPVHYCITTVHVSEITERQHGIHFDKVLLKQFLKKAANLWWLIFIL